MNAPSDPPTAPSPQGDSCHVESLSERTHRLTVAVRAAGLGTWSVDFASDSIALDEKAHALLGLAVGSFGGKFDAFLALVHPEDRDRVRLDFQAAQEAGRGFDSECRVVWPVDATLHSLRIRGKCEFDPGGRPTSMAGACWDVTERRRVEAELEQERRLLRALMDVLPDKIYFKDTASRFICVNKAKLEKHGLHSAEEIVGKTDFDFFTPERAQQAYEDEQRIMSTGEPLLDHEEKDVRASGNERWVSTTKLPLRDAEGRIVGTFGLSRDVTARKEAEEKLAQYAGQLEQRNGELQQDLEMARELQAAMLPQQYPRFPRDAAESASALRFFHYFSSSSAVSGDFFTILQLSDTRAGVFICDVMGHGVRAALVAAVVRTLVEDLRAQAEDPGELLGSVNRALCAVLQPMQTPIFVSAFYAVADLATGELHYANGGHPQPLRIRRAPEGHSVAGLNGCKPGPALGLFPSAQFPTGSSRLAEHDMLMLFTDGLFEVENTAGQTFDPEQLRRAVEGRTNLPAEPLCREVVQEVRQFSASKDFTDDMCLVAVEVERLGG
jgi:sigma-B regulation protein RsbU (phosphoserine phosphatase)